MPNGRSGVFVLRRSEFEQLLSECEGDVAVGHVYKFTENAPPLQRAEGWDRFSTLRSRIVSLCRSLYRKPPDNVGGKSPWATVTAFELRRVLDQWKGDRVVVEEQYQSSYIVHFAEWVTVKQQSPIFDGFRRYHAEARKEQSEKHQIP
jgi:hypothetical protein